MYTTYSLAAPNIYKLGTALTMLAAPLLLPTKLSKTVHVYPRF